MKLFAEVNPFHTDHSLWCFSIPHFSEHCCMYICIFTCSGL